MADLTHFDKDGHAIMVDVSAKAETDRLAVAEGCVVMQPETLARIMAGTIAKGDVLGVARLAGIMAAKRTHDLIPLCHPLPLTAVSIELAPEPEARRVRVRASVRTTGKTGVEMEAMTAVCVACLTIYDMCKAIDRGMLLTEMKLLEKSGGQSGHYIAKP
jgi:cyclic pyranopterin phosphate synthase